MILTDADELRLALAGAEASLVAEREHSERLRREAAERHDELRAEIEDLRSCLAALQETRRATMRVIAEGQREACAEAFKPTNMALAYYQAEEIVRATPLVTEGES